MIVNVEITVFTPTYNRAYIINRLYESLQRQEIHNFEWLVVDDGSVDETEELFRTWMNNESKFPIRYYKKKNGGKCRAINFALDLAKGKLFFVVDSDDYLTDDALKKIIAWEKSLPKDEKYCGVAGNLGMSSNFTPNTLFETDYYDGTLLDRYRNIDGERALAFFTEIHKKYRYPEYSGEKFMTEAVIYNRMANDGYKMRFYNDIVWIYEYRSDGLTKAGNSLFLNNPRGYGLWLKEKALFMNFSLIKRIKMYYTFSCDLIGKYSTKVIAECIGAPVKSRGIARDLFGNEENYVLPVQSLQEPDELTKHFRWLVGHEKEIKDHLEKIMPEYISKAYSGKMALDKLVR